MAESPERRPLPLDPLECKQRAEAHLGRDDVAELGGDPMRAIAWSLLAVAAELHVIRREYRRRK